MVDITGSFGRFKTWVKDQLHTDHQSASSESASFKDVDIAVNEAYKQATKIILRIKGLNTFVGEDAGKNTTADNNNFVGYRAGYTNVAGHHNNFIGGFAGNVSDWANYCNFIGDHSGTRNTWGYNNNFMGAYSGDSNTVGYYNNFMGNQAGYLNSTGHKNCFVGSFAGFTNTIGNNNTFLGSFAGYYETGNNKLFIDDQQRSNEADGRIKALLYGIFDAATANQLLRINGILELTEIKNGATQAGAGAAANEVWKTNGHASLPDNVLMIGV